MTHARWPHIRLRPVREDDLPYFDRWDEPGIDPFNTFGFPPVGRSRKEFAETAMMGAVPVVLVEIDGEIIGDVGWHEVNYGPPGTGSALNIGIRLLPEHRGRGYGAPAQRELADYLFETYAVNRVEATTDLENLAEQRALDKAGFIREGIARGAQWRVGAWHDMVVYSRLRSDP